MVVILDLVPVAASLHSYDCADAAADRSISMLVRLDRDKVRTKEGRDLSNAEWTITLHEGPTENEHVKNRGGIGMLNYHGEYQDDGGFTNPQSCDMWAHLSRDSFVSIRKIVMTGRLPSSLRVHVRGLTYGWEPDGSAKEWDISVKEGSPICAIEVTTPMVRDLDDDDDAAERDLGSRPVTVTDLQALERSIAAALPKIPARIEGHLSWIFGTLVLLVAVLLFR